ncbi:MAG: hypothetical protein ACM3WU_01695 [Bacillota bacterium]
MNQGISGNWQSGQWTGTQSGEGQSGMGPSSLASGARWVGHSSFSGTGQGGNFGNIPQGNFGQGWSGMQSAPSNWSGQSQSGTWTGTQYGEGQPGMGPSSLAQGAHWVGHSSFGGFGGGILPQPQGSQGSSQFGTLPAWTRNDNLSQGYAGQQGQSGWGQARWTGTQYGEGQPGMGPSSLAQGARWVGHSSFQGGMGGQQGISGQGWTGTQYGEGQPGMGPSSLAQGAHWVGQSNMGSNLGGQSSGGQQQVYLPPWTRGSQGGQSQ